MALDTVFLDAGGVIVFPNWHRISEALARHGVYVDAEQLASADPHARRALDVPETIAATTDASRGWPYFHLILQHAGIRLSERTDAALDELRAYHDRLNLWELVPDDVRGALRLLKARYRVAVISNANGTVHAAFDRLGLTPLVDFVIDSAVEGVEKPDPRIFQIALARAGVSADHAVHAGDMYQIDVMGARAAGIDALLIDAAGLYGDADCPRYASLAEVAVALTSPQSA
jgi:HAD superfamily hydrolase (TIGR01549 family)